MLKEIKALAGLFGVRIEAERRPDLEERYRMVPLRNTGYLMYVEKSLDYKTTFRLKSHLESLLAHIERLEEVAAEHAILSAELKEMSRGARVGVERWGDLEQEFKFLELLDARYALLRDEEVVVNHGLDPFTLKTARQRLAETDTFAVALGQGELLGYRTDMFCLVVLSARPLGEALGDVLQAKLWWLTREYQKVEEAVAEQQALLRQVVDVNPNFVFVRDEEGRYILANRAIAEAYNVSVEELIGKSDADFLPPDVVESILEADRQVLETGEEVFIPETFVIGPGGREMWIQTIKRPLVDKDGVVRKVLGVSADITRRKEIEESLRRSEERFRMLFEAAPDGITLLDGDGFILDCNPAAERIYGQTVEELVGQRAMEFILPAYRHSAREALSELQQLAPQERELRLVRADGQVIDVWRKGVPLLGAGGELDNILVYDRDITALKRAEEALRVKHQQAETLLAATQALSSTLDLTEVLELILSELQEVVPYDSVSVQRLEGDTLRIIGCRGFPDPEKVVGVEFNLAQERCPNRQVIEGKRPVIVQEPAREYEDFYAHYTLPHGIGSWLGVPLVLGDRPIGMLSLDKKEVGFYGQEHARLAMAFAAQAAVAIEHARMFEETRQAKEAALEASRLKSHFLARISHELRTPLGAILGYSEFLRDGAFGPVTPRQREVLERVIDNTNYLTDLVNDLLDQAQIEAGGIRLKVAPFDLRQMLGRVEGKMAVLAEAKGLTLVKEVAPDVPSIVYGDERRVQQVLVNLLGNAVKFTVEGHVALRVGREGQDVVFEIEDTGPGIPPEARSYIFDPFRQVDDPTVQKHAGSGLGLSIVRQLTALMGGKVLLESEVGRGSTFTVKIPLLREEVRDGEAAGFNHRG